MTYTRRQLQRQIETLMSETPYIEREVRVEVPVEVIVYRDVPVETVRVVEKIVEVPVPGPATTVNVDRVVHVNDGVVTINNDVIRDVIREVQVDTVTETVNNIIREVIVEVPVEVEVPIDVERIVEVQVPVYDGDYFDVILDVVDKYHNFTNQLNRARFIAILELANARNELPENIDRAIFESLLSTLLSMQSRGFWKVA